MQGGQPVAYASRSLTNSVQHYAPIELECLAIVFGLTKFDQYVFGHPLVTVHTDHQPLVSILKKSLLKAPRRLQAMIMHLQRYSFTIEYQPGSQQVTADMLSRSPNKCNLNQSSSLNSNQIFQIEHQEQGFQVEHQEPCPTFEVDARQDCRVTTDQYRFIQQATSSDPLINKLMEAILGGWPKVTTELAAELMPYWSFRDELAILDGIIYKGAKIVIPPEPSERNTRKVACKPSGDSCDNTKSQASSILDEHGPRYQNVHRRVCHLPARCTTAAESESPDTGTAVVKSRNGSILLQQQGLPDPYLII